MKTYGLDDDLRSAEALTGPQGEHA